MNLLSKVVVAAALISSGSAYAQTYVSSQVAEPYVALDLVPGVTSTNAVANGYTDAIELGFTFHYFAEEYTQIGISSNGWIAFGANSARTATPINVAFNGAPGNERRLAPFWDDLPNVSVRTATIGVEPNRIFVVEWAGFARGGADNGNMQLWLHEGPLGRFEFAYGGTVTANGYSATVGYEHPVRRTALPPCGQTASCSAAIYGTTLRNRRWTVERATAPELSLRFISLPRGAFPGDSAAAMISVQNSAIDPANDVLVRAYFSLNVVRDAADVLAGEVTIPVVAGDTTIDQSLTINVPGDLPINDYYLILETIDPDALAVSTTRFATAHELRVRSVSTTDADGVNPGESITFDVELENTAIPFSGDVELSIYASADRLVGANDRLLSTETITLNGSAVQAASISLTMPALTPGSYYPVARIAPVGELNELDNSTVGTTAFATGPDFSISVATTSLNAQPGSQLTIDSVISSNAVPFHGTVEYELSMIGATDQSLGTFVVTFAGEASVLDSRTITVPAATGSGIYHLSARVDPNGARAELDEMNNTFVSSENLIVGLDFTVLTAFITPNAGALGTEVRVRATIVNSGTPFFGFVPYQVHLSIDQAHDAGDTLIHDGLVFLNGEVTSQLDESFDLPQVSPGSLYVIVSIDPADQHHEISETNNWTTGNQFNYRGSDLRVVDITGPSFGFIGHEIEVETTIANDGEVAASGFRYAYYLSEDTSIRVFDQQVLVSAPITMGAGARQTFVDHITIPSFTSTQTLYLGVIVNIDDTVLETSSTNNIRRLATPLSLLFPTPDLSVSILDSSASAAAGDRISIQRVFRNDGTAAAPSFEYRYYLSENPAIGSDDVLIGTFTSSLDPGQEETALDVLELPWNLPARTYYLGVFADPMNVYGELNRANNVAVGAQLTVLESVVRFVTASLPNAKLGVAYEAGAFARAPSPLTYSIGDGALPDGLTIDAATGIISGLPTREGLFSFTVVASAFSAQAEQRFEVRVTPVTSALAIGTDTLPNAVAGRPYEVELVAIGGNPPITWSATTLIPPGMTLSAEGRLSGVPATPGFLPLSVEARDQIGETAFKELVLHVVDPQQTVVIQQSPLPSAIAGRQYCDVDPVTLEASGGVPPYSWSLIGGAPEGMSLSSEGSLCGLPAVTGRFAIQVRVQDQGGLSDTSLFILEVVDQSTLILATTSLAVGRVGVAYEQTLSVSGGEPPYQLSIVSEWGPLPAGLTLSGDKISGTPTVAGFFAIAVRVTDARLGTDVQTRVLEIEPVPSNSGPEDSCSCASMQTPAPANAWSWALLAAFGLVFFRARIRRAALMMFAATFALDATAVPVPGAPYDRTDSVRTYEALANPTQLMFGTNGAAELSLPFAFRYYDDAVSQVAIGENGLLSFDAVMPNLIADNELGTVEEPNGIVAPFWDDLVFLPGVSLVGFQLDGAAPERTLTIEWRSLALADDANARLNFQVHIHEGPGNQLDIDYGPMTGLATAGSATIGMEDQNGGRPIVLAPNACNDFCTIPEAPAGTRISLVRDPGVELVAIDISAPAIGFLEEPTPIQVVFTNVHRGSLGPFTLAVLASKSPNMTNAVRIFEDSVTVNGFEQKTLEVSAIPAAILGTGIAYLSLSIDADDDVEEVDESNNTVRATETIELRVAAADVEIESIVVDRNQATAGGPATAHIRVSNTGSSPIPALEISVVLSSNPVISVLDGELSRVTLSIQPLQTKTATLAVVIPESTASGSYYLGALADPDEDLDEFSELNNASASAALDVTGAQLAIFTTRLPNATLNAGYDALIAVTGGRQSYNFSVVQGILPAGISLGRTTGQLFGRSGTVETQTFTVRVTSGSETAEKELTLSVVDPELPLTIVTHAVPAAVVDHEYMFELHAAGGAPDAALVWSGTSLPAGFTITALDAATGLLSGVASEAGTSTITISVSDGVATDSRMITLEVRNSGALQIVPKVLSTARDGQPYSERLEHQGGTDPVAWVVREGSLPNGIVLSSTGALSGAAMEVGDFRVVVEARDAAGAVDRDTFHLTVIDSGALSIQTAMLPEGFVDTGYDTFIAVNGGVPPYSWSIVQGELPDGLVPATEEDTSRLRIAGAPEEEGAVSLLIRVVDRDQREATKAFVLRVSKTPVVEQPVEEGCSCSASGASRDRSGLAVLLLLAAWGIYRRRALCM